MALHLSIRHYRAQNCVIEPHEVSNPMYHVSPSESVVGDSCGIYGDVALGVNVCCRTRVHVRTLTFRAVRTLTFRALYTCAAGCIPRKQSHHGLEPLQLLVLQQLKHSLLDPLHSSKR